MVRRAPGEILQVFIDVEDVILRGCLDAQIVQQPEKLRAMIGAVIGHMQQHLPQDKILVLSSENGFSNSISSCRVAR